MTSEAPCTGGVVLSSRSGKSLTAVDYHCRTCLHDFELSTTAVPPWGNAAIWREARGAGQSGYIRIDKNPKHTPWGVWNFVNSGPQSPSQ